MIRPLRNSQVMMSDMKRHVNLTSNHIKDISLPMLSKKKTVSYISTASNPENSSKQRRSSKIEPVHFPPMTNQSSKAPEIRGIAKM